MRSFFVAGTEAGCGLTAVSCRLLASLRAAGQTVAPMRPITVDAAATPAGLRSEQALELIAAADLELPYADFNPYAFESAGGAPHLAAAAAGVTIEPAVIREAFARLREQADRVLVEGPPGWLVPLDDERLTLSDLVRAMDLPVVLVVGVRSDCIGLTLLTVQRIMADGIPLVGWVANPVEPGMAGLRQEIATLERWTPVPRIDPDRPTVLGL